MSELLVLAFDEMDTAEKASQVLADLEAGQLKQLNDVVIVVRHEDGKPQIRQLKRFTGSKALGGTFWGFLIGLIFFVPVLGALVGAVVGTAYAFLHDAGIPDDFIKQVSETVKPGTSALFMLVSSDPGQVLLRLKEFNGVLVQTTLSDSTVDHLRDLHAVD
jgi:uncharacterized membrane protein